MILWFQFRDINIKHLLDRWAQEIGEADVGIHQDDKRNQLAPLFNMSGIAIGVSSKRLPENFDVFEKVTLWLLKKPSDFSKLLTSPNLKKLIANFEVTDDEILMSQAEIVVCFGCNLFDFEIEHRMFDQVQFKEDDVFYKEHLAVADRFKPGAKYVEVDIFSEEIVKCLWRFPKIKELTVGCTMLPKNLPWHRIKSLWLALMSGHWAVRSSRLHLVTVVMKDRFWYRNLTPLLETETLHWPRVRIQIVDPLLFRFGFRRVVSDQVFHNHICFS